MKLSVVIPARDEAGNLGPTLDGVRERLKREGITYEIAIVNDGSPMTLLRRCKQGAGPSRRSGFCLGLDAFRVSLGIHGALAYTLDPNQAVAMKGCDRPKGEVAE